MKRFSLLLLITMSVWCSVAQADGQLAREDFEEGKKQFDNGQFDLAAQSFRRAYEQKPTWKLQYNIGHAEAAAGRYGFALDAFEKYLAEGKDDVPIDRSQEVEAEMKRLRLLVGVLQIDAPDNTELYIDDTLRGVTPAVGLVRVAVGQRHVVLKNNGEVIYEKNQSIVGGISTNISARRPSDEPTDSRGEDATGEIAPPSQEVAPVQHSKKFLIGGIVSAVLGAGGIGLGIVATSMRLKDLDERDDAAAINNDTSFSNSERAAARNTALQKDDEMKTDAILMGVGFGVGAALAATAAVLFVVHSKKKKQSAVSFQPSGVTGMTLRF